MAAGFITETAVYDLPHKGYICTRIVQSVIKSGTLLILSANDDQKAIQPLTSVCEVDNMRPVHTIPL
ncbi:hypothetical protein [Lelliottia amnigena]|jgi:hypothetical protein|uniref:hypothetical protein n=1 Tax=Lelliottia amnigena TaxID=61646 RepID=UPI001040954F|nr:hypothetical protein [Lelliottia amnigena]MCU7785364.1 hypothetical protein [Lelliottia amnigena]TCD14695.1 hypothetical protein E0D81_19675 [Lelliottia amnigena]